MEAEERVLESELDVFEDDVQRAEHEIEAELRKEHFGRDPERPLSWKAGEAQAGSKRGNGPPTGSAGRGHPTE